MTSAVWQDDAPFIIGIGVTVAITAAPLIFPVPWSLKASVDEKKRFNDFNTLGDEDTKFTAMAVISFLPLFNWLVSPLFLSALQRLSGWSGPENRALSVVICPHSLVGRFLLEPQSQKEPLTLVVVFLSVSPIDTITHSHLVLESAIAGHFETPACEDITGK